MSHSFKAINLDKQEYICSSCMGGGAKFWEWVPSMHNSIFTLLLRRGDECVQIPASLNPIARRWAADRVSLVDDDDSTELRERLPQFRNITNEVVDAWNAFIGLPNRQLTFRPDCGWHASA